MSTDLTTYENLLAAVTVDDGQAIHDPATGDFIGTTKMSTTDEVDAAVATASPTCVRARRTTAPLTPQELRWRPSVPRGSSLLVGPGQQVGVTALGRRTVVVSRGLTWARHRR